MNLLETALSLCKKYNIPEERTLQAMKGLGMPGSRTNKKADVSGLLVSKVETVPGEKQETLSKTDYHTIRLEGYPEYKLNLSFMPYKDRTGTQQYMPRFKYFHMVLTAAEKVALYGIDPVEKNRKHTKKPAKVTPEEPTEHDE